MKSLTVSLAGFKDSGGTSLNFPTIEKKYFCFTYGIERINWSNKCFFSILFLILETAMIKTIFTIFHDFIDR